MTKVPRPSSGTIAGIMLLVGVSAFGDTPDTRDSSAQVARYFVDHRTSIFVGVVIVGVSMILMVGTSARIATVLESTGQPVLARIVQSAAAVVAGIVIAGMMLIYAALSYVIGAEVPEMAKGFFELTLVVSPVVALPVAALMSATGLGALRAPEKAGWFGYSSLIAAAIVALMSCGFAASGPASPDVEQQLLFGILAIWLIASGRGLSRLRGAKAAERASVDLPAV